MARNLDPKCKQCRRAGEKLFLKGERCAGPKCGAVRRNYPPGQHGQAQRRRGSEYSEQLHQKQKVRKMYGMMERDFRSLFERAHRMSGDVSSNMIRLLEMRLDNVVYRLGFAASRSQARQLVRHGHVSVDGKNASIPSQVVSVNAEISVKPKTIETSTPLQELQKQMKNHMPPSWLSRKESEFVGTVVSQPAADDLKDAYRLALIIEFYSR